MAHQVIVAAVAVLAVVSHVSAQWWDMMGQTGAATSSFGNVNSANLGGGAWGFGQDQRRDNNQYLTCLAKNYDGDELKVTFTLEDNNPWAGRGWGSTPNLRVAAVITVSPTSSLQGQVELAVTTGSRSEEMCISRAFGTILDERNWWSMSRRPNGIIGTPIHISPGHTATISEQVTRLQFRQLVGRGLLVCPSQQISGTTCNDPIPLCCKLGYDRQPATTPISSTAQMFPQGTTGQAGGFNGGLQFGIQSQPGNTNGMQFGIQSQPGNANGMQFGMQVPGGNGMSAGAGGAQGFSNMGAAGPQGLPPMGNGAPQAMGGAGPQSLAIGGGAPQGMSAMGAGVSQGMGTAQGQPGLNNGIGQSAGPQNNAGPNMGF